MESIPGLHKRLQIRAQYNRKSYNKVCWIEHPDSLFLCWETFMQFLAGFLHEPALISIISLGLNFFCFSFAFSQIFDVLSFCYEKILFPKISESEPEF
jgi:hypothetical protein